MESHGKHGLLFMHSTGPIDLGFNGSQFTWSNKRDGLANVKERLDKAMCSNEWQCLFPKSGVKNFHAKVTLLLLGNLHKACSHCFIAL